MAAATGTAALFRSMVTSKMARSLPPHRHRVIPARGLHGGGGSGTGSGTSSSGVGRSSPNPNNCCNEDLAARNQEVLRQVEDHSAEPEFMAHFKTTANTCATVLVLGAGLFDAFVRPRLNRLEHRADTLSKQVFKLKQELLKLKKDEGHKAKSL